jgi:hypothetical protein
LDERKSKSNHKQELTENEKQSYSSNSAQKEILSIDLNTALQNAVNLFPSDSASIINFYKRITSKNANNQKHIERIISLTSEKSVKKYRDIEENLKPLLNEIFRGNSVNKEQLKNLVVLYSDYDYFMGESLFLNLITIEESYEIVWGSFAIIAKQNKLDSCSISALIQLDKKIRTNAELAQSMPEFIITAIKNNPTEFLEMYANRSIEHRPNFSNYISLWDTPDKELISIYKNISLNSENEKYRTLATELLKNINID